MSDDVTAIVQGALNDLKESGDAEVDTSDSESAADAISVEAAEAPTPEPEPSVEAETPEPVVEAKPVEPAVVTPPADEEADLKAIEAELVAKTPGLAKGKISQVRHQAVVTRIRRQAEEAQKATIEKFKMFDTPDAGRRLGLMDAAESRPKDFFHGVLLKDPIYQQIIKDYIAEQAPVAAAPVKVEPELTAPEPDEVGPDGSLRFSLDGQKQLARYEAAQLTKALKAEIDEMKKSVNPVLEERTRTAEFTEVKNKQKAAWSEAVAEWDGFADHQQAVADFLLAPGNERVKLDAAYRKVVIPLLKTDKAKLEAELRAKWNAEVSKAPAVPPQRIPANGHAPAVAADPNVVRDTNDIVRESYRKLAAQRAS